LEDNRMNPTIAGKKTWKRFGTYYLVVAGSAAIFIVAAMLPTILWRASQPPASQEAVPPLSLRLPEVRKPLEGAAIATYRTVPPPAVYYLVNSDDQRARILAKEEEAANVSTAAFDPDPRPTIAIRMARTPAEEQNALQEIDEVGALLAAEGASLRVIDARE
jgi:hypothetical protein